jgi:hypothetical protein
VATTFLPLALPPGIYRNGTKYQSRGRWYDASLVRFFSGSIGPVGGWTPLVDDAGDALGVLDGIARGVFAWRGEDGNLFLALGTTEKLYLFAGGVLHDITPVGFTPAASEDSAPSGAFGLYGEGPYGTGAYGSGASTSTIIETSNWHLDNFGNYLVAVSTSDNKLYVWEGNVANPAIEVSGTDFPTHVTGCVVTPEGFLVALGWSAGEANVRGVTWASQRTYTTWTADITNSAGDFDLATSGRLMTARRTRNETLLWTDTDVHVMTYIGGTLVYRFAQAGDKCGAVSPRSPVVVDTRAMWMGNNGFFAYDGFVKPVPCDVQDYVFGDFNEAQKTKVWGTSIAEFGEVWWFYPSRESTEVDRYVVYNYVEGHWTIGQLARTAGCDAGPLTHPVMVDPSSQTYEHEQPTGRPTDALLGPEPLPYAESGPVQLGEGERLYSLLQLIPDERTLGDVTVTLYASNYPNEAETESGPHGMSAPVSLRVNARAIRLRLTQDTDTDWRVGQFRLAVKPGSRR